MRFLGPRHRRISYASGVFFTLAMHMRLLANFPFRHFDLLLGPPLHRLPTQQSHLLDDPLFGRVRLLEISLRVLYCADDRCDSISKIGMRAYKRKQSLVTHCPCRHLLKSRRSPNRQNTSHHFESHPARRGRAACPLDFAARGPYNLAGMTSAGPPHGPRGKNSR